MVAYKIREANIYLCIPLLTEILRAGVKEDDMGIVYAKQNCFQKEAITKFAAPEKYSKIMAFLINLLQPLNVIAWDVVGKK